MYNKLFVKILDSSIWLEPVSTRIVWITLLAAMDEDGYAHFSAIDNLASRARVSIEDAEAAIKCFLSPDPNSSNPDNEGRRVERVPGGFLILNAKAHRSEFNRVIQREQTRLRVVKHRSKRVDVTHPSVTPALQSVTPPLPTVTLEYASEGASDTGNRGSGGKGNIEEASAEWKFGNDIPEKLRTEAFASHWHKWLDHLSQMRRTPSIHSQTAQLAELSEMGVQKAIATINHSIHNNWQSLHEEKASNERNTATGGKRPRSVKPDHSKGF